MIAFSMGVATSSMTSDHFNGLTLNSVIRYLILGEMHEL